MTASFERLFEYVASDQCVAFVGAGASVDAGLPGWKTLVKEIGAQLTSEGSRIPPVFDRMLENEQFLGALGLLERTYTLPRVITAARKSLGSRHVVPGLLHALLGRLPFRAYLTTNYDTLLLTALRAEHRAPTAHENTRREVAAVDLDLTRPHVRLHGHLDDPPNLVLTESQCDEFLNKPDREYYREWLKSVLMIKRVVFIGYSLKDPDLTQLLAQLRYVLGRNLPNLAILPDISEDDRKVLWERYRIEVVRYNTNAGRHDELRALLEVLASSLSGAGYQRSATPEVLRAASALWMWYRGTVTATNRQATVAAAKALVVGLLGQKDAPISQADAVSELQRLVAADPRKVSGIAEEGLAQLVAEGLVTGADGTVVLTERGRDIWHTASDRVEHLFQAVSEHLKVRAEEYHLPEGVAVPVAAAGLDALVEAAVSRGMDVRTMLRASTGRASFQELVRIAGDSARKHGVLERAHVVAAMVARELGSPAESVKLLVDYLARASACFAVLGMDPDGQRLRQEFLSGRALILDSNVLIQLLAEGSSDSGLVRDLIPRLREVGVVLASTLRFISEVEEHLEWAKRHVRMYGELSAEVLEAARGVGAYDHNEFLEGFINWRDAARGGSFSDYVKHVSARGVRHALEDDHRVVVLELNETLVAELGKGAVHEESMEAVRQIVIERGQKKRLSRADAEADALTWLRIWPALPETERPHNARCVSLLSRTGFLRAVTRVAGLEVSEPVVVRPEVLAEYMWSIQAGGPPLGAAADAVRSAYIHSVSQYLDSSVFERVFEPLIRESEQVMEEIASKPEAFLAGAITQPDMREIPPLDRPSVAEVLVRRAQDRLHELEAKVAEGGEAIESLLAELRILRKQNEKLQEVAKYKEKQRKQERDRGDQE